MKLHCSGLAFKLGHTDEKRGFAGIADFQQAELEGWMPASSVTRLGAILPFGRFLKAFGAIFFQEMRPKIRRNFGRFFDEGENLNFLCTEGLFE